MPCARNIISRVALPMTEPTAPPPSAILIVNALSRQGRKQFDAACAGLKSAGVDLLEALSLIHI